MGEEQVDALAGAASLGLGGAERAVQQVEVHERQVLVAPSVAATAPTVGTREEEHRAQHRESGHGPDDTLASMLLVHETHVVAGEAENEFEALWRDRYVPEVAKSDGARLLWYLHHAHGTGPSYAVVTITAVRDASVWDELGARLRDGDLAQWAAEVDTLRHDHAAKVLTPLAWSPLQDLDLGEVPTETGAHDQALFMEDTAWPYRGRYEAYLEAAGTQYVETLRRAEEAGRSLLRLEAAFSPVWGTGRRREIVLWQRVVRPELLVGLLAHDVPEEHRAPGTWMHDALEVRDRWESRLLRCAPWSPLA